MSRPVTIFSGQWADLSFEEICQIMSEIGYDGIEIATWADFDVRKAAVDPGYVADRKAILQKYNLKAYALGSHLTASASATYGTRGWTVLRLPSWRESRDISEAGPLRK